MADAAVVLRPFDVDDVGLIQEASTDPLIPLITTVPTDPGLSAARAFIDRQHERARRAEGYSFAVAEPDSGKAVGQIGLWLHDLRDGRVSVGYWIAPSQRLRGFAAHALALVSAWGIALAGVHRLELYVEPWNEASWRTAERVGYRREGLLRSWQPVGTQRRDMYMYALLAEPSRAEPSRARPSRAEPDRTELS